MAFTMSYRDPDAAKPKATRRAAVAKLARPARSRQSKNQAQAEAVFHQPPHQAQEHAPEQHDGDAPTPMAAPTAHDEQE